MVTPQLLKRLATIPGCHVVCEATDGYKRAVVAALHTTQIPVSVINPARASGELAKTGPIDAAMLTAFGQAFVPEPTPPRTAVMRKLIFLMNHLLKNPKFSPGPTHQNFCNLLKINKTISRECS